VTSVNEWLNEIHPYPKDYLNSKSRDEYYVSESKDKIFEMAGKIDFATETPLKAAILLSYLKRTTIWEVGFRTGNGMWYPSLSFTYDCCKKIHAPTIKNPLGLKHHFKTEKHLLNFLSTIFDLDKELIKKELPTVRMMFAMDSKLQEELVYRLSRWYR